MSCAEFIVGQRPRFEIEFRVGNILTDPTVVKFIYQRPDEDTPIVLIYGVDPEIVRESVGDFYIDLDIDVPGQWKWRWEATGTVVDAKQGSFIADPAVPADPAA